MSTVDLTNCDREPIHIPGSVQPHGCMLVCDEEAVVIRRHSVNATDFLGLPAGSLVGRRLEDVMGGRPVHELRNALARSGTPARAGLMPKMVFTASEQAFDVSAHRYKGNAIIEFERSMPDGTSSPLEFARTLVGRLSSASNPRDLISSAVRLLRAVLQYDRVMIYRFAADGSGQVVSEAKRGDLESFMGQHFPASDIPKQARQLYLLNPIRLVSNSSGERFAIEPVLDESGEPLDLSYAHLRSVSPIHCEYLRNMGVAASMSVSIIVDGELWGLIACHHYAPRSMSMNQRIAAEIFGEFFALQLSALTQKQALEAVDRARAFLGNLLASASHSTNVAGFLGGNLGEFRQLLSCDGIGLLMDGQWSPTGSVPPAEFVPELAGHVGMVSSGAIWSSDCLSASLPNAGAFSADVSGVLAVPLSQLPRDYLFFFRREFVQTIEWGGDPNKTYASGPLGDRLTPRQSFAVWKQTVENRSRPWTQIERELAESARSALVEVVLRQGELLAEERKKAVLRQKILNQELSHRVKNILSVIKSIVSYPVGDETEIAAYIETIKGRIEALSHAHDQVMRSAGGGALRALVEAELGPYKTAPGRLSIEGPDVALDARAFSVMALVIHELATNAAKYGALSRESGRLSLIWEQSDDGACRLLWRESGGPEVNVPTRQGFGSVLVSRSIPFDLGGSSEISYLPEGVEARLAIPAVFVNWLSTPDAGEGATEGSPDGAAGDQGELLAGKTVLLVEDQFLIAMEVEEMLRSLGAGEVVSCASVREALAAIERRRPECAVLDVSLGAENSDAVAQRLRELAVPYVFATGYDAGPSLDNGVPALRKPYTRAALATALAALQGRG